MARGDDALTLQLELRGLFRERPVVVGHVSQWPEGANVMTTWLAGMPIVLVREPSGLVRGFVNVCAHRGAVLEEAEAAHRREFVCRHHGWRYGLDGSPSGRGGSEPLKRVAVSSHGNLLWACLSPPADPPALPELSESVPARRPEVVERQTVQAPWKRALWERLGAGVWLAPNAVVVGGGQGAVTLVEVIPLLQDACTVVQRRWTAEAPGTMLETETPPGPPMRSEGQEAFWRHWRRLIAPGAHR